ncbi:MAG: hypothetical protein DRO04_00875, partial [Candidatus Iainarchaeum archaeon]
DTPGLLDKPEEKRNLVEKKAVSALRHLANLIIFVFDPTADYKKQLKLLNQLKKMKVPIIVLISKTDIAPASEAKEMLKDYTLKEAGFDTDEGEIKRFILERLK